MSMCHDLSGELRKMFTIIKFSEKGSNRRDTEEAVYMFFVDFLDDCEKGIRPL